MVEPAQNKPHTCTWLTRTGTPRSPICQWNLLGVPEASASFGEPPEVLGRFLSEGNQKGLRMKNEQARFLVGDNGQLLPCGARLQSLEIVVPNDHVCWNPRTFLVGKQFMRSTPPFWGWRPRDTNLQPCPPVALGLGKPQKLLDTHLLVFSWVPKLLRAT